MTSLIIVSVSRWSSSASSLLRSRVPPGVSRLPYWVGMFRLVHHTTEVVQSVLLRLPESSLPSLPTLFSRTISQPTRGRFLFQTRWLLSELVFRI